MKYVERRLKQKFSKLLDINKKMDDMNLENVKRILFFKVELKIGEYVVGSFIFREIKRRYPDIKIDVFVGGTEEIKEFLKHNPHIDSYDVFNRKDFFEKFRKTQKILKKSKGKSYDILFDLSGEKVVSPKQLIFMRKINARVNIGYDKDNYKIYNRKVLNQKGRMVDIWGKMLKKMGIKEADLSYEIPFSESSERRIDEFFKEKGIGENIAINFFGSLEDRKINVKNAVAIIKKLTEFYPEHSIVVLDSPSDRNEINEILNNIEKGKIHYYKDSRTIMDAVSIIKRSDLVVSPDTSIVHIAEGLNKKILAFYENNEENFEKNRIYENSKIIIYDKTINGIDYENIDYSL